MAIGDTKRRTTSARELLRRRAFEGRPEREAVLREVRIQMSLGDKIRKLREEHCLTQKELADRIQTHASAISRLESAEYDGHSVDTLRRIAEAFGLLLLVDFIEPDRRRRLEPKEELMEM